ncbi:transcriptional protein SWT1-like [Artemia franciscana]|uniref:transcriptional protein SWT1-like n=1 Tax=Artemia franciscana TaxID=6661 RepID=UPI0032DBBD95
MDLLPDWIKVESRRKPGVYYYFNSVTGQSSWDPPNIRTGEPSTDSDTRRLIETAANENNHREKIVVNLKNDENRKRSVDANTNNNEPEKIIVSLSAANDRRVVKAVRKTIQTNPSVSMNSSKIPVRLPEIRPDIACPAPPKKKMYSECAETKNNVVNLTKNNTVTINKNRPTASRFIKAKSEARNNFKRFETNQKEKPNADRNIPGTSVGRQAHKAGEQIVKPVHLTSAADEVKAERRCSSESRIEYPNASLKNQMSTCVSSSPSRSSLMSMDRRPSSELNLRRLSRGSQNNLFAQYAKAVDSDDEMDWDPIPEEVVTKSILNIRQASNCQESSVQMVVNNYVIAENQLVIVVDTNIWLSHLSILVKLREMAERNVVNMILLIPWIVVHELDCLKSNPELEIVARKAGKYIQRVLENKEIGLVIQTTQDAKEAESLFDSNVNDDKILKCCLYMKQRGFDVALLSNDNMLLTKAMGHSMKAFSRNDIAQQIIDFALPKPDVQLIMTPRRLLSMIEEAMICVCSQMIEKRFETLFEELWPKIICIKPPFSDLCQVFQVYLKHWIAVFGEIYPRGRDSDLKTCKELLLKAKDSNISLAQVDIFVKNLLRFLEESKPKYDLRMTIDDAISLIESYYGEFKMQNKTEDKTSASILCLFQAVWATIHRICGSFSETLGVACDGYEKLSVPVTISDMRELIPSIAHKTRKLQQQVEMFLRQPHAELSAVEFFTFLVNFLPRLGIGMNPEGVEKLSLQCLLDFVKDNENVRLLQNGLEQVKGFCSRLDHLWSLLV